MEKELVISSTSGQVEIALLENARLVEIHSQKMDSSFSVGDIYLGSVKKLMPGLNAAFIEIGHEKDAFLHYTDLGPNLLSLARFTRDAVSGAINGPRLDHFVYEPEILKTGRIDQVLSKRDLILVQILKEPISTKGPRLSCELAIPGRFLVLTPLSDIVAVSKKIANGEERKRLKILIESIKPKNFGIIVRTAAEGKGVAELHEELNFMLAKWNDLFASLHKASAPLKLLSELDKTSSILRDLLSDSFNKILVDDQHLYQSIRSYMATIAPDQVGIVQRYKGSSPVFEAVGIVKQIKASFGKTATMSSGAYLVIEHTEAMHVIDVNSGHKMSSLNADEAIMRVNTEAAAEIARQVRLRDIGGLIIIDFIDMKNAEFKKDLLSVMRNAMKKDRAQHSILPLSKFGLMQITRQRVRPEVKIDTSETCPHCVGTGKINASILIVDEIERDLEVIFQSRPDSRISLAVHPYIAAFLKSGFPSQRLRWSWRYHRWLRVAVSQEQAISSYRFFDENQDQIRLNAMA